MKCPSCGGQMGLEDASCPYCGTPNAMAIQHQSDMNRYRAEYERTQSEVLENTTFMKRNGSWLIILVILLIALVGGIVLQAASWDIGYSIREKNAERTMQADKLALDSYLEQGDYGKFVGYYDANDLYYMRDDSYMAVQSAARAYADIIHYVGSINDPNEYSFNPDHISNTCEYIARDLNRIFTLEQQYSYGIDEYLPASMRGYADDMRERTGAIAMAYFGFTKEDVQAIPDLSIKKLASMIEEGIAR
ncbi:MAG: hypothetical protein IJ111_04210 [Eggerthellaceae bacterium]|nr:hypothetical protein [Eggerthellaceae bacterium]